MKNFMIIPIALLVSACATAKNPQYVEVKSTQFMNINVDKSLFEIPDHTYIDTSKQITDADIAKWIISTEKRSVIIEQKLKTVEAIIDKFNANITAANEELKNVNNK